MLVGRRMLRKGEMVHHRMSAHEKTSGPRMPLPVEHDIKRLSLSFGLHLPPVEIEIDKCRPGMILHQRTTDIPLEISQRITPQKTGQHLAQLGSRKHTHRHRPAPGMMAPIKRRRHPRPFPFAPNRLVPHHPPGNPVPFPKFQTYFRRQIGEEICLRRCIAVIPLPVIKN